MNACEHNETFGVQRNGTMTELVAVPWQKVIVAEGLSARDCALVEPLSVGFHAVSRAQVTDIDSVQVGDLLTIHVKNGRMTAQVKEKEFWQWKKES